MARASGTLGPGVTPRASPRRGGSPRAPGGWSGPVATRLRAAAPAPLAPAPDVERAPGEAGGFEREERVARGDAAPALEDQVLGRRAGEELRVDCTQLVRRLEATVGAEVLGVREVD